jgi:hypothetical protein
MYNLVCFPHYTCGGLLADILNDTWSEVASNGGISSLQHNVGKLGDSDSIFDSFTQQEFDSIGILAKKADITDGNWLGTHCWPGHVTTDKFDTIINVTTATSRSKMYRWARTYHHYYLPRNTDLDNELDRLDKFREGAKQYLIPFTPVLSSNVINIEFFELVDETREFTRLIEKYNKTHILKQHMTRWRQLNSFLYDADLWNSYPVKRFYEAEYETALSTDYIYY